VLGSSGRIGKGEKVGEQLHRGRRYETAPGTLSDSAVFGRRKRSSRGKKKKRAYLGGTFSILKKHRILEINPQNMGGKKKSYRHSGKFFPQRHREARTASMIATLGEKYLTIKEKGKEPSMSKRGYCIRTSEKILRQAVPARRGEGGRRRIMKKERARQLA